MNRSPLALFGTALAIIVTAVVIASPALADRPTAEVGVLGGLVFPDDVLIGHGTDADDVTVGFGLNGNWFLHDNWAIYADGLYTPAGGARFGDVTVRALRVGPRLFLPSAGDRVQFFLSPGIGWMSVDLDDADSISRPFLSAGFGQRYLIGQRLTAHWELRGDVTATDKDDDVVEQSISQGHALVGLSWRFGGVSTDGDADRDGVRDSRDACPDTPRGAKVDANGCPLDTDGDGVWDGLDQCPGTPAGARVDSRGCSDSDGDGVTDDKDRCPDTPAGWPVDSFGCPLDTDGDGVADGADECPNTPRGTEVDAKGCPKVAQLFEVDEKGQTKALILQGVNFEYNSANLTADSRGVLDRVAESLVAWPDVRVEIGGHTDSDGSAEYNRDLSQRRSDSVRAYLVQAGVGESRMTTRGYGEESPIATNGTPEGKAQNRRVELKKID
ncbi:MAG: OmpA family protein [Candidatus Eiseniibacteriota bacterium]